MTFGTSRFLLAALLMTGCVCMSATTWAACSNPIGQEGETVYNGTYHTMQFCNGTQWMAMGGVYSVPWSVSGTSVYYSGGRIGVGTGTPQSALQIQGADGVGSSLRLTRTSGYSGDWVIGPGSAVNRLVFADMVSNHDNVWFEGNGDVFFKGTITQNASDIRLKKDIAPIENALGKILSIRGVSFNWKDSEKDKGRRQIGVIAQEVEVAFPEIVKQNKIIGYKSVDYQLLVAPLIEAVRELNSADDRDQAKIESLEVELEKLKQRVEQLESGAGINR